MGSEQSYGPGAGARSSFYAIVVASEHKHLAFLVREVDKWNANGPWVVYEVIVRNSVPGAVDFPLSSRCKIGWRSARRRSRSG